jgi:hypothetical protein
MRFMVVERFKRGPEPVYARAAERGRMLPPGLSHVESWIDSRHLDRCFQLMETDDQSRGIPAAVDSRPLRVAHKRSYVDSQELCQT